MKKTQETLGTKDNTKTAVLYIAFELSHREWKLALSNGEKMRTVTIEAGYSKSHRFYRWGVLLNRLLQALI